MNSKHGPAAPVVDVRAESAYVERHAAGSAPIPLEQLAERVHELPDRDVPVAVYDDSTQRADAAIRMLVERGWKAGPAAGAVADWESGPSRVRLWRPNRFLEEVIGSLHLHSSPRPSSSRAEGAERGPPMQFADHEPQTTNPKPRRALDIACGSGRDAVWLALQGFTVTAIDVLPDAIARAGELAERNGVPLDARVLDTEKEPLAPGRFDLVTCFSFLQRDLFDAIRERVAPAGSVVYETFLVAHREKYGKPKRDAFLLQPGELPTFFPGWTVRRHEEGEFTPGRITARLWAVKQA